MNPQLDKIDRRILYELDQNCRIPETRLAKIVGKSKESVRYRIKNLRESGIIRGYSAHINVGELGYKAFKVYLKIREKPLLKHQFLEHLKSRSDIYWLAVGDGAWNVGITFLAKNSDEFYEKKNELYSRYRDLVLHEVNGMMVGAVIFGKKFLLGDEAPPSKPSISLGTSKDGEIDEVERKILASLLRNSRIKHLEERGIIQRYQVDLDYQKLGMEFYKTFVYLEGFSPAMYKRIYELSRRHPNVIHFVKTIAPWAIELEIMVDSYPQLLEVINHLRRELSDVLINIEITNLSEDLLYPAKVTIFDKQK